MEWPTKKLVDKVRKDRNILQEKNIKHHHEVVLNYIIENAVGVDTIRPYCLLNTWKTILNIIKVKN